MLKNYFKIGLRNILKHKAFSFINIFGLAVSISVCLLALLLIKDTHSFDQFHPEGDRVYRVLTTAIRKAAGEERYASSPYIVGKTLKEDYSQVELWTPLVNSFDCDAIVNNNRISGRGLFTDASFFELFGFELEYGNAATALNEPFTVVLTKEMASKLFKEENPIGQSIQLPAYEQEFSVTGVLKEFLGKTHLEFDALGSLATQLALEKQQDNSAITSNFRNYYSTYNFVRLKDNSDKDAALAALGDIVKTHYADLELETRDAGYTFSLQALDAITPGPIFSNNMGRALPIQVLWFISALSLIVILSACFNYTNLTIARSLTRAREVGVRKVMGASRSQIFGQFISEALMVALLSLGLAYLILQLTIPAFNSIQSLSMLDIHLNTDAWAVILFLGFAIVVGFIAGLLPALVLSKMSPLSIIQKLSNIKLFSRIGLRKALIVGQFAVSLVFILLLTIIWKQIDFAIGENFGSDRNDIINVQMYDYSYEKLVAAFEQLPQINKISASSHLMGTWQDGKVDVKVRQEDELTPVRDYIVDHHYIDNFRLDIIVGENFPVNPSQQEEVFAIVNEDFLEHFELGSPAEALGKAIILGNEQQLTIRAIIKDFLYKPLVYNIEPLLLRYRPEDLSVMNLSINTTDVSATLAALERTWKQVDDQRDLEYAFYDATIEETYMDVKDMGNIVGYFGIIGLIIACLGLLGMAIYSVETKAKEISIRKVIGASAGDLIKQLSKGYIYLLVIAAVVALPVSFFIGKQLLQTFAFAIDLNFWVFLPGLLVLLLLGALTIGSQTVKAAFANPIDSLRNE